MTRLSLLKLWVISTAVVSCDNWPKLPTSTLECGSGTHEWGGECLPDAPSILDAGLADHHATPTPDASTTPPETRLIVALDPDSRTGTIAPGETNVAAAAFNLYPVNTDDELQDIGFVVTDADGHGQTTGQHALTGTVRVTDDLNDIFTESAESVDLYGTGGCAIENGVFVGTCNSTASRKVLNTFSTVQDGNVGKLIITVDVSPFATSADSYRIRLAWVKVREMVSGRIKAYALSIAGHGLRVAEPNTTRDAGSADHTTPTPDAGTVIVTHIPDAGTPDAAESSDATVNQPDAAHQQTDIMVSMEAGDTTILVDPGEEGVDFGALDIYVVNGAADIIGIGFMVMRANGEVMREGDYSLVGTMLVRSDMRTLLATDASQSDLYGDNDCHLTWGTFDKQCVGVPNGKFLETPISMPHPTRVRVSFLGNIASAATELDNYRLTITYIWYVDRFDGSMHIFDLNLAGSSMHGPKIHVREMYRAEYPCSWGVNAPDTYQAFTQDANLALTAGTTARKVATFIVQACRNTHVLSPGICFNAFGPELTDVPERPDDKTGAILPGDLPVITNLAAAGDAISRPAQVATMRMYHLSDHALCAIADGQTVMEARIRRGTYAGPWSIWADLTPNTVTNTFTRNPSVVSAPLDGSDPHQVLITMPVQAMLTIDPSAD